MKKSVFVDFENRLASDQNCYSSTDQQESNKRRVFGDLGNRRALNETPTTGQSANIVNRKQILNSSLKTNSNISNSSTKINSNQSIKVNLNPFADKIEREYMSLNEESSIKQQYKDLYSKKYPTIYKICNEPGTYDRIMGNMIRGHNSSKDDLSKSTKNRNSLYYDSASDDITLPEIVNADHTYHQSDVDMIDYLSMFDFDSD